MINKIKIFIFVAENNKHRQQNAATDNVDIGNIEYRKINQRKINKVCDITVKCAVNKIAECAAEKNSANDAQRRVIAVFRNSSTCFLFEALLYPQPLTANSVIQIGL